MHTCFDSIHINCLWEKYDIVSCIIDAWGHMEILPKYFYTDRKECRRIRGFLKYTDPALKEQSARRANWPLQRANLKWSSSPANLQTPKRQKMRDSESWDPRQSRETWQVCSIILKKGGLQGILEPDVHCVTDRSSNVLFNFINKF